MQIKEATLQQLKAIVDLHLATFSGFFLTFLGPGFLRCLYQAFLTHDSSELLTAENEEGELLGFVAFSNDLSALYRYLLRRSLIPLGWYSFLALLRQPSVLFRLLRGISEPRKSKRAEKYAELSSIGVSLEHQNKGIGSVLINEVIRRIDFSLISYLKLETDAENNEAANLFYVRNGFEFYNAYRTKEGRKMNEYRYSPIYNLSADQ